MPVYTYRCDNCGVQFDRRQSFNDPMLKVCPDCGKKSLHKVYQPVGIVFKGSGFYATDHRSPSGQQTKSSHEEKPSSSTSGDSSSESTSTSPSSESKSAKTTESSNSSTS